MRAIGLSTRSASEPDRLDRLAAADYEPGDSRNAVVGGPIVTIVPKGSPVSATFAVNSSRSAAKDR